MSDDQLVAGRPAAVVKDDEEELVAGRKPALKVGKMRVRQHKTSTSSDQSGDVPEDCTGLTQKPNIQSEIVSGAQTKGNADFQPQAAQVAHAPKPAKSFPVQHAHTINQPRK